MVRACPGSRRICELLTFRVRLKVGYRVRWPQIRYRTLSEVLEYDGRSRIPLAMHYPSLEKTASCNVAMDFTDGTQSGYGGLSPLVRGPNLEPFSRASLFIGGMLVPIQGLQAALSAWVGGTSTPCK